MRFEKRAAKKSKSGYTWRVSFEYLDIYRHKKTHSKSGFKTKRDAEAYAIAKQKELDRSNADDMTVDMIWQEVSKGMIGKMSGSSIRVYNAIYYKHIKPNIGDIMVKDITYPILQHFLDSNFPTSLLTRIKTILSKIIQYALRANILTNNPLAGTKIKSHEKKKETPLTLEDIEKIVQMLVHPKNTCDHLRHYSYACLLLVGYYTGLRASELLALEWPAVDLENKMLSVCKQMKTCTEDGKYLRITDSCTTEKLKSKASRSVLPIPDILVSILKEWKNYRKDDSPLLFTDSMGQLLLITSVGSYLKKTAGKVGIEGFHLHKLRHAYITQLVVSGVDAKTAMTLARHSDVKVTLQIYTDISDEQRRLGVNKAFS